MISFFTWIVFLHYIVTSQGSLFVYILLPWLTYLIAAPQILLFWFEF
jgi:hypothetical protein